MSPRDTYTCCDYCKREGHEHQNYKCSHCGAIGCYREGCPNRNWTNYVWSGDACWACGKSNPVAPQGDAVLKIQGSEVAKHDAALNNLRDYRASGPRLAAERPSPGRRFLQYLRAPKAAKRVVGYAANGATTERFRSLLLRAGCTVENVETDGDNLVIIAFTYLEDGGHCTAVLADRLSNGSWLSCNIVTRVGVEFSLDRVNQLNQYSKFLRFYNIRNNSLFIEYPFVLIDLPDNAVLANIELCHGSLMYLVSHGFTYDGMNGVATAPAPETASAPGKIHSGPI